VDGRKREERMGRKGKERDDMTLRFQNLDTPMRSGIELSNVLYSTVHF